MFCILRRAYWFYFLQKCSGSIGIGDQDASEYATILLPPYRGTEFSLPIEFLSNELERMQLLWEGHLRALGAPRVQSLSLPGIMKTVIDELNQWLSLIQWT